MKWLKRLGTLVVLCACLRLGYEYGRVPAGGRAKRLAALVRALSGRLGGRKGSTRVADQLRTIRGQNDRILRQNERIYVMVDRVLSLLESQDASTGAHAS